MSAKIPWQEPKNYGLIFVLLGLAAVIQFIIISFAAHYYLINSFYIFLFVSIGVIVFLAGIEILFAQIIHSFRVHLRQSAPAKAKRKLKKISEIGSIFIGSGITLGLFAVLYVIFAYYLIDPFTLIELPIYGKFTLAEILAGITLIIIFLIWESIIHHK